jgi:protein SCO1/2
MASIAIVAVMALAAVARAHDDNRPAALRDVAFEQKLDQQLPLDLTFRDSNGQTVRLRGFFGRKPVLLNFVYYRCRDLCPLVSDGIVRALRPMSFDIGKEFDVVTVSFDPADTPETAATAKDEYLKKYRRAGAGDGWHVLTGSADAISQLAGAAGFRYTYDDKKKEFAHATGIVLVTPQGKISRYYYGIEFSPRDLRLGLIEAAAGKIGSPIDQLLLFCYHYDPLTGRYNLIVTRMLRLAAGVTVLALAGLIIFMLRREQRPQVPSRAAHRS